MYVLVEEKKACFASGGRIRNKKEPAVIFIHGAGMDRTVWQLQTRNIAYMGRQVFALDLPGHGRSQGPALSSIEKMADWVIHFMETVKLKRAKFIGHSMGALVALEISSRYPQKVDKVCLMGVASKMPVHRDLLEAAKNNLSLASELIVSWGLGDNAQIGGHPLPGLWLTGSSKALLKNSLSGVLYQDLAACDLYQSAILAARIVRCPSLFILGENDKMTPLSKSIELAESIQFSAVYDEIDVNNIPYEKLISRYKDFTIYDGSDPLVE